MSIFLVLFVKVTTEPATGGQPKQIDCDVLLVCVGRKPYTNGLGLDVR